MGKRSYLSFLLLSITAFLSCSSVPKTSLFIGNSFFQLSESLNLNLDINSAGFLPDKRIVLAGGALINNERVFTGSETPAIQSKSQNKKCGEDQQIRKNRSALIFGGGTAYLLIGNS